MNRVARSSVARSSVAGLVLAAGEGRRLGQPKALVTVGGRTLLARAVRVLAEGGCADPVIAVVADRVPAPDEPRGARLVTNPFWRAGMGSSLRCGLDALAEASGRLGAPSAVVIGLVDQPLIGPHVVRRLIAAHEEGAEVVVAAYGGAPRNPVLVARAHWDEVAARAVGDVGARPFLRAHPELVKIVECGDIADPFDIDTRADLIALPAADRLHPMQVVARSEVGQVRSRNEDACLAAAEHGVFVVADGMGGHPAGDVASRVAVEALRESLIGSGTTNSGKTNSGKTNSGTTNDAPAEVDPATAIRRALEAANEAVGRAAHHQPGRFGMGTTAVVLLVRDGTAWVGHVGDSRAYQFTPDGRLTRLTVDHSSGGYITQALGLERRVDPDVIQIPADGLALLCTDGLTNMVDDGEIERILAHAADLDEGCDALVTAALEAGGIDNVTVLAVLL